LNSHLLRLTGEARFGDELERSFYNHLAAAQKPDGAQWCYYTALEGTKPYGPGINCCVSSGPRGMALIPQNTYFKTRAHDAEVLLVNLFEASSVTTKLDGQMVTVEQKTDFPRTSGATLTVRTKSPVRFGMKLRAPQWSLPLTITSKRTGTMVEQRGTSGWAVFPAREWREGDVFEITFALPARVTPGLHGNAGKSCLRWGPLVLAYDVARNPDFAAPGAMGFVEVETAFTRKSGDALAFEARLRSARDATPRPATFLPFADTGADGGAYRIWLRAAGVPFPPNASLFGFGNESRSRSGNVNGSICDGDPATFVVTFNARRADEDWFAISLETPMSVRRIVFAHGHAFHDGGWFDTSTEKPRVQVQRTKGGAWETMGTLDSYPATSATDSAGLRDGQSFAMELKQAISCVALRVVGKPAHGDNPAQAFSSCAELQAFER